MRTMTTVSIELPPELLLLLDQHVRAGKLPSRSEAIYALLDSEDTKVWNVTLTDGLDDDAPRGD
jgi:Arc/MetJ-type ribon-helix-helix transcriptional regulator